MSEVMSIRSIDIFFGQTAQQAVWNQIYDSQKTDVAKPVPIWDSTVGSRVHTI